MTSFRITYGFFYKQYRLIQNNKTVGYYKELDDLTNDLKKALGREPKLIYTNKNWIIVE